MFPLSAGLMFCCPELLTPHQVCSALPWSHFVPLSPCELTAGAAASFREFQVGNEQQELHPSRAVSTCAAWVWNWDKRSSADSSCSRNIFFLVLKSFVPMPPLALCCSHTSAHSQCSAKSLKSQTPQGKSTSCSKLSHINATEQQEKTMWLSTIQPTTLSWHSSISNFTEMLILECVWDAGLSSKSRFRFLTSPWYILDHNDTTQASKNNFVSLVIRN